MYFLKQITLIIGLVLAVLIPARLWAQPIQCSMERLHMNCCDIEIYSVDIRVKDTAAKIELDSLFKREVVCTSFQHYSQQTLNDSTVQIRFEVDWLPSVIQGPPSYRGIEGDGILIYHVREKYFESNILDLVKGWRWWR